KYVFRNKLNHKGERTLYLQYYVKCKPIFSSSGVAIKPTDWNERSQQVKRTNTHHTGLNNALKLKKQQVDDLI
ncbi:MAG: hypothetical protein LIP06_07860, partial [Tannerellaceae bacterium]|nr:hypothetical protein [Tannerellaceae bacterium]